MGVKIKSLHIEYPGKLLFDGVNLEVSDQELIAVQTQVLDGGTSLLKGIAGQLNGVGGEVWFEGHNLLTPKPPELAIKIGYVYEDRGLLGIYNTQQNICLPLLFHTNLTTEQIYIEMEEVCRLLRIPTDQWSMRPHQLNDVQTRMVNLARALITRPGLLLIDELEGGMSDDYLVDTIHILRERQKSDPMAIITTTSSEVIMSRADRVYKIEQCNLVLVKE